MKSLKHQDLWDVKRKPPLCANGPPPEGFIIYYQSSAPSADDYLINADYPIETYIKKNSAAGAPVNDTQIGLNFQFHRKN
jgi:hypothetical protein